MKRFALLVLCVLVLVACSSKKPAAESYSASLSAYNHTEDYIHQFYVDGAGGGNSSPYGGGGSSCAASLLQLNGVPGSARR